jgi:hypothetical protein
MMSAVEVLAIVTTGATAITIVVSVFSLQTARTAVQTAQESDRRGRMPVLVCPRTNGQTVIQNLGSGPALNVAIARAGAELSDRDALEVSFGQLESTSWSSAGHLQPIEPGKTVTYEWHDSGQHLRNEGLRRRRDRDTASNARLPRPRS